MAIIAIFVILAIMVSPDMAINMADIGVISKNSQNAVPLSKRLNKIYFSLKVIAKTIYGLNLWPFPLYFGGENGHSEAGTSHGSSELIFIFLESGEQDKWD